MKRTKRWLLIGCVLIIVFSVGLWRLLGDFWNVLVAGIGWPMAILGLVVFVALFVGNILHRAVTFGQRNAYRRPSRGRHR